jgi:hypothetical protein
LKCIPTYYGLRYHRDRLNPNISSSLLADPPDSQVSGALQTLWDCYKTPAVGGEKCSSCGTLREGAIVESEDEEKAGVGVGVGVDDGVEDGIDIGVGVNVGGGEIFLLLD